MKKIIAYVVASLLLFAPAVVVRAQVISLNGETGATQTFANDTNITISSSGDVHTLGWTGTLDPSRGGTGTSTTITEGSLLFAGASGIYSEDNANLFWDNIVKNLKLDNGNIIIGLQAGHDTITMGVPETYFATDAFIKTPNAIGIGGVPALILQTGEGIENTNGGPIDLLGGRGGKYGAGGTVTIMSGHGNTENGAGGDINIQAGYGFEQKGGNVTISSGISKNGGDIDIFTFDTTRDDINAVDAGDISITAGSAVSSLYGSGGNINFQVGTAESGAAGKFTFTPQAGTMGSGVLNFDNLIAAQTYTFQDATGTLPLLEVDQIFTGINTFTNPVTNFISTTDSTVHIGADGFPGCIVMGDSDSSGITYITADNGVISASSSPPANCN